MLEPITSITRGSMIQSIFFECSSYLGKKIDNFCYNTLPDAAEKVYTFAHLILSNFYYILPAIAFTLGHYNDTILSSVVCGHDSINWVLDTESIRETTSIAFILPVALSLTMRIARCVVTKSSYDATGVLLQAVTLAKLIIIKNREGRPHE